MERLDDDGTLARVTYLPGVTPVEAAPESPLPEQTSSSRSLFADRPAVEPAPDLLAADLPAPGLPAPGAARHVSITALARRGLSRRELERHLRDRGFDDAEIADEVARLERDGYVDDIALAQNLVGTLQERKGLGRSAIAAELTRRHLAPAAIEYALDLIDTGDELSRARELALKRAGQLRHVDRDTAVRRLSAYLARRGYGGSTIRAAVDQALPSAPRSGVAFR
jgi:regulatory protein